MKEQKFLIVVETMEPSSKLHITEVGAEADKVVDLGHLMRCGWRSVRETPMGGGHVSRGHSGVSQGGFAVLMVFERDTA